MNIKSILLVFILMCVCAGHLLAREVEPNDTPEEASPLINENIGQTGSFYFVGEIIRRVDNGVQVIPPAGSSSFFDIQDDYDYYYFDAQTVGLVPITFYCNTSTIGTWQVSVHNKDGVTTQSIYGVNYTQCRDSISGGFKFIINANTPGRYYVLIRGPLHTENTIDTQVTVGTVTIQRTETTIATVGGDIQADDYLLKIDASYRPTPIITSATGQINSITDNDFFSVHADSAKTLSVAFSCNNSIASPQAGDWIIRTYTPNRYLISSYAINFSQCREESVGGSGAFVFDINATGAGDYLIEVRGPDISPGAIISGTIDNSDYQLSILSENPTALLFDNANRIKTIGHGQISSLRDKDYFYVDANKQKRIPMAFACNGSTNGNWILQVYDKEQHLQSTYPVSTQQCCGNISTATQECSKRKIFNFKIDAAAAGRYYVVVSGPEYSISGGTINPINGTLDQSNYALGKSGYLFRSPVSASTTSGGSNTGSNPN
jgi:hypothetical protein